MITIIVLMTLLGFVGGLFSGYLLFQFDQRKINDKPSRASLALKELSTQLKRFTTMNSIIKHRRILESAAELCGHEVISFEVVDGVMIDGTYMKPVFFNPLVSVHDLYHLEEVGRIDVSFTRESVTAKSTEYKDIHETIIYQSKDIDQMSLSRALASCRVAHRVWMIKNSQGSEHAKASV